MARHRKNSGQPRIPWGWILLSVLLAIILAVLSVRHGSGPAPRALIEHTPSPQETKLADRQALVCGAIVAAALLIWFYLIYRAGHKK